MEGLYLGKTWRGGGGVTWPDVELITFSIVKEGRKKKDDLSSISRFYAEIQSISVHLFCLKMQANNIAFYISAVINIRAYKGETEIPIFRSLFLNLRAGKYLEEDKCGDLK